MRSGLRDRFVCLEPRACEDAVAAFPALGHSNRVTCQPISSIQDPDRLRQLAAGIAHEYNNLLTGIIGGASLALDTLPLEHPARAALKIVSNSGEHAAALTRQIMAYAGISLFVASRVDLSALVGRLAASLRGSIPERVQLRVDLPISLPPVWADSCQIEQLIQVLITNAVEAITDGAAGTVSISTCAWRTDKQPAKGCLGLNLPSDGPYVRLHVSDTGCGMADGVKCRIFEPFFSTKFVGRGLGLAAVAGIVGAHGGAIEVQSAPGSGSTFYVYLPVLLPLVEPETKESQPWQRS